VSGPSQSRPRSLTPAVAAAIVFLAAAALASVSFVVARGGLELPLAATPLPVVAVGSPTPAAPTFAASLEPTGSPPPSSTASSGPSPAASPSARPTPAGSPDPLLALATCPGHPGCYLYTVRRGDTFSGVSDRFRLQLWITRALNPELGSGGVIVVGQTLYLGRDPEARLDPCPDGAACRLYVIRSGDTLSGIADRYGVAETGILALNPGLSANSIVSGQEIRLPPYA
jgi:nucleoid-associated protein YgaU